MLYIEITLIITFIMVVGMMAAIGIKGLNDDIAEGEKWAEFFENNPFPTRSVDESPYIQHDFRLELQLLEEEYMLDMDTQGTEANEDIIDLFTQEEIIRIVRKDS